MNTAPLPLPALPGAAALTVDLEDWHALAARRATGRLPEADEQVIVQTRRVLALLAAHGAPATFFVLGHVAEKFPDLVREVHRAGHEVASHGYGHVPLHRLSRRELQDDLDRSVEVLRGITGERPRGHRAPEFSVSRRNPEALQAIADAGFAYDSSIYPIVHRRYGIPAFPRRPTRILLPSGQGLTEFPLATWRIPGATLPVAGGGYFRFMPARVLRRGVREAAAAGDLPVLYFHPYEFSDVPLRTAGARGARLAAWERLQNVGRDGLPAKLPPLLSSLRFVRLGDLLEAPVALPPVRSVLS